jgi:hypothetical protein
LPHVGYCDCVGHDRTATGARADYCSETSSGFGPHSSISPACAPSPNLPRPFDVDAEEFRRYLLQSS